MTTRGASLMKSVSRGLIWLFLLPLVGCVGTSPEPVAVSSASPAGVNMEGVQFNPNIRIGEVIWINDRGDFAVVRMDAPRPAFQPAFLLASDPMGVRQPGVLIGGGQVEGRSFGARIVEGVVSDGAEVRIPGPEWTEYLFSRYNQAERLPASADR